MLATAATVATAAGLWFLIHLRQESERRRIAEETQRDVEALIARAEHAAEQGSHAAAAKHYEKVLTLDQNNVKAILFLAAVAQENGRLNDAKLLLARVTNTTDQLAATAKFLEGTIALEEHQAQAAESLLKESHRLRPEWFPPLRELLQLYSLQLRDRELTATLEQVQKLRPLTPQELATKLLAGRPLLETAPAVKKLATFLSTNPQDLPSAMALLRSYLSENKDQQAAELLETLPSLQAGSPDLQAIRALLQEREGATTLTSPFVAQLSLNQLASAEAWEVALHRATRNRETKQALQIAGYLAMRQPFSTTASHALAQAYERSGNEASAKRQHDITRHLDQVELLAYRMFRPQAQIPEMAFPVMLEIAEHLEAIERFEDSRQWLMAAGQLMPGDPAVQSRLQGLSPALKKSPHSAETARVVVPPQNVPPLVLTRSSTAASATNVGADETEWDFQDVAAEMGLTFQYHNGGSPGKRILETVGGGSAVLDLDGDLWPDLYFPQGQYAGIEGQHERQKESQNAARDTLQAPALEDQVFRNFLGTSYRDVTMSSGIHEISHSLAATVGDFDSDGFPDVFVANVGSCRLYHNEGDGTFSDVTPVQISANQNCSSGACFADLNADGLPELFVLNYVEDWNRRCVNSEGRIATCDPRELKPAVNRLYQNLGDGEFQDITDSSGLSAIPGRALGVIAADLNGDGRTDLFVANDGMPNTLLTVDAQGPAAASLQLRNIATQSGVAVPESGRSHAGMGVALADFDANGLPDLFVTNFYREQNTLYQGIAPGLFLDNSVRSGLGPPSLPYLGFGTQAIDVEGDGDSDIVILNGDIDDYSATGRPWKMPITAFRNAGNGQFDEMTGRCGPDFGLPMLGRGVSLADVNGDLADDLIAVRHDGPVRLLKNHTPQQQPGICLRFAGRTSARDGRDVLMNWKNADGRESVWLAAGSGFSASNEKSVRLHAADMDTAVLQVHWGGKITQIILGPNISQGVAWETSTEDIGVSPLVR